MTTMEISTTKTFEAAHRLPNVPSSHKCHNMHGHNYVIEVVVRGCIDTYLGWVIDYATLDAAVDKYVISVCDHTVLNEVEGLDNPTAEVISVWALRRLRNAGIRVSEVSVWETPKYKATARYS